MSESPDRDVFDEHNGRPTLYVDEQGGVPTLNWMLMGHVEPFSVWLRVPLLEDELQAFAADPPLDVEAFVFSLHRRFYAVEMFEREDTVVARTLVPNPVGKTTLLDVWEDLDEALKATLTSFEAQEQRARSARQSLPPFALAG